MAQRTAASLILGVVLVLALASATHGAGDPTEKLAGVHDLTPETFPTTVTGAKAALVEFYAPWCGHCKHLVPEYKKLGELVAADPKLSNRVVIGKVDADSHRSLGEKFGVQGFPTIKFLPRGKVPSKDTAKDYQGARTAEAFIEFIKKELEADKGFARVEALDDLAKEFVSSDDKKGVIAKVSAKVADLKGDDKTNGDVYVKVMEKAVEKGGEYLSKEKARLDKMLSGGSVAASKLDEFSRKLSVISAILGDEDDEE